MCDVAASTPSSHRDALSVCVWHVTVTFFVFAIPSCCGFVVSVIDVVRISCHAVISCGDLPR